MSSQETNRRPPGKLIQTVFWTALINAIITFPWLIALLYCSGNIEDVINSKIGPVSPVTQVHHPHPLPNADSTNQPPKIFFNSTNNAGLAIFLAALSTYLAFVGGIDAQGSCARTLWAMARDGAFPRWLRHVHPSLDVPVASVVVSAAPQLVVREQSPRQQPSHAQRRLTRDTDRRHLHRQHDRLLRAHLGRAGAVHAQLRPRRRAAHPREAVPPPDPGIRAVAAAHGAGAAAERGGVCVDGVYGGLLVLPAVPADECGEHVSL